MDPGPSIEPCQERAAISDKAPHLERIFSDPAGWETSVDVVEKSVNPAEQQRIDRLIVNPFGSKFTELLELPTTLKIATDQMQRELAGQKETIDRLKWKIDHHYVDKSALKKTEYFK